MEIDIGELLDRLAFPFSSDEEKEQFLKFFYYKNYSYDERKPKLPLYLPIWREYSTNLEDLVSVTMSTLVKQTQEKQDIPQSL